MSFLPKLQKHKGRFGGTLHGKGNPKGARSEAFKSPMHITLKSSQAVSDRSFLPHAREIEKNLRDQAKHFHIDSQLRAAADFSLLRDKTRTAYPMESGPFQRLASSASPL